MEGLWRAIDEIHHVIDDMQIADEVTERVKVEIEANRKATFGVWTKVGAFVIGVCSVGTFAIYLLSTLGVIS